jgi:hypothetical protein|nr:MAG TPA: hypothetical protein [Bacteriophage sp.]
MEKNEDIRSYNVGNSNYSKHKIQPWDIWREYNLNPWDADIVKRILREKEEPGMSKEDARIMDYEKIIHICKERIRQIEEDKPKVTLVNGSYDIGKISIPKPSMTFTLSPEQLKKYQEFQSTNTGLCSIKFTPTGVGLGVEFICGDNKLNVSEYEKW